MATRASLVGGAGLVCALALAAVPVLVPAARAAECETIDHITTVEMKEVLEEEGYRVTEVKENRLLRFKIEGTGVGIFVAENGRSIQFHAAWAGTGATMEKVNRWNRERKYSKAYLDDEDDPHIELDLELDGGITRERISGFLVTCKSSLAMFQAEVLRGGK